MKEERNFGCYRQLAIGNIGAWMERKKNKEGGLSNKSIILREIDIWQTWLPERNVQIA